MDPSFIPFFRPRGVVLVGASHDPGKLGYGVAAHLGQSGYQGAIHFVNPKGGRLFDRPVHADLSLVPDPVDLAVLIIPAPTVPKPRAASGGGGGAPRSSCRAGSGRWGRRARPWRRSAGAPRANSASGCSVRTASASSIRTCRWARPSCRLPVRLPATWPSSRTGGPSAPR